MTTYSNLWQSILPHYDAREAQAVVRLVLDTLFGFSLTDVVCGKVSELSADDARRLEETMARLRQGEPVQHVLGEAWFMGRRFVVTPNVLIPRPETEFLPRWAADTVAAQGTAADAQGRRLLDVGTGSGCIAIMAKLLLPASWQVEAWDVSPRALAVAQTNARELKASVTFREADLYAAMPAEGAIDVLLSNPPYIAESERTDMAPRVERHEPALALFVTDADPLRPYRALARMAAHALRPATGLIALECNTRFVTHVAALLAEAGLTDVATHDDCFSLPRFVTARRP